MIPFNIIMVTMVLGLMGCHSVLGQRNQCSTCSRRCPTCLTEQSYSDNLYVYGGQRHLNSVLENIEHRLEECVIPDCDPETLRHELYHEIPSNIHSEFIDNLKTKMVEGKVSMMENLMHKYPEANIIAYPNKQTFKSDESIFNHALNPTDINSVKFTFDPDTIDFGVRPIGLFAEETFRLKNCGSRGSLRVDFFTFDTPQFLLSHPAEDYFTVREGQSLKFNLRFIPSVYGNITGNLFFRITPNLFVVYRISGFGTENAFELRPIMMQMLNLGKQYSFPVEIFNPFPNTPLIIQNISTIHENVTLLHADSLQRYQSGFPITIPPLKKKSFINIQYTPTTYFDNTGKLIIKANGIDIVIPMRIIISPHDILITPVKIDFGTITLFSKPMLLKINIMSQKDIVIVGLVPPKNPDFVCNFPLFQTPSIHLSAGTKIEGYIGFYATSPGMHFGNMIIHTQFLQYNIEFQAEVVNDFFRTTLEDTSVDVSGILPDKSMSQHIFITSTSKKMLLFSKAEIAHHSGLEAYISCPTSTLLRKNGLVKNCLKKFSKTQRDAVAEIRVSHPYPKRLPYVEYLSLLATTKLFHIPITFYDSGSLCSYWLPNKSDHFVKKKCAEISSLDLGGFSLSGKSFCFNITNPGIFPITINSIQIVKHNSILFFEIMGIFNSTTFLPILIYNTRLISHTRSGESLTLEPNTHIATRIALTLDHLPGSEQSWQEQNKELVSMLQIASTLEEIAINLNYQYYKGEIKFSPSQILFDPGFPGQIQVNKIKMISTFSIPVTILNTYSEDPRIKVFFEPSNVVGDVGENIYYGNVSFIPELANGYSNFISQMSSTLDMRRTFITLQEVKLWGQNQAWWSSLLKSGKNRIEIPVRVQTDIVKNNSFQVLAEIASPKLWDKSELHFGLIQNGSSKNLSIKIHNPSESPMLLQVFLADPINSKNGDWIRPGWKNKCPETYQQWKNTFSLTVNQISRNYKITKFQSYEDFAESYCCYFWKFNSSDFFKLNENEDQINNKLSKQYLNKKCDSLMVFQNINESEKNAISNYSFEFSIEQAHPLGVVQIAPKKHCVIGPITYNPKTIGDHHASLYLKNNLTLLYPINLKGSSRTGIAVVIKDQDPLMLHLPISKVYPEEIQTLLPSHKEFAGSSRIPFQIIRSDLLIPYSVNLQSSATLLELVWNTLTLLDTSQYRVQLHHQREYSVKNEGSLPLIVYSVSIEHRGCQAYGLSIKNCRGFTLQPQETHKIIINYNATLTASSYKRKIIFYTKFGPQTFGLHIQLPFRLLHPIQKLPAEGSTFTTPWRVCISIILIVIGILSILVTFQELIYRSPSSRLGYFAFQDFIFSGKEQCSMSVNLNNFKKKLNDISQERKKLQKIRAKPVQFHPEVSSTEVQLKEDKPEVQIIDLNQQSGLKAPSEENYEKLENAVPISDTPIESEISQPKKEEESSLSPEESQYNNKKERNYPNEEAKQPEETINENFVHIVEHFNQDTNPPQLSSSETLNKEEKTDELIETKNSKLPESEENPSETIQNQSLSESHDECNEDSISEPHESYPYETRHPYSKYTEPSYKSQFISNYREDESYTQHKYQKYNYRPYGYYQVKRPVKFQKYTTIYYKKSPSHKDDASIKETSFKEEVPTLNSLIEKSHNSNAISDYITHQCLEEEYPQYDKKKETNEVHNNEEEKGQERKVSQPSVIPTEGSEKSIDQPYGKYYNPFEEEEHKLPKPFSVKKSIINDPEEIEKEKNKIKLYQAFMAANSLVSERSFFSESHPLINNITPSPLCDLGGEVIERPVHRKIAPLKSNIDPRVDSFESKM